jgi:uncharacterized protein YggL (DUF469 family)
MNKRLRKKFHKGEFKELGFEVKFRFTHQLNEAEEDAFFKVFISEAVEGNNLGFCGGGDMEWEGFLSSGKNHGLVTEEHRQAIIEWLGNFPLISEYEVGPLKDVWYD